MRTSAQPSDVEKEMLSWVPTLGRRCAQRLVRVPEGRPMSSGDTVRRCEPEGDEEG